MQIEEAKDIRRYGAVDAFPCCIRSGQRFRLPFPSSAFIWMDFALVYKRSFGSRAS